MLNKLSIIGNVGADSEIRTAKNGNKFLTFSLAYTKFIPSKDKEGKNETIWFECIIWGDKRAESLQKIIKKSQKLYVAGEPLARGYISERNGKSEVVATISINVEEIVFCGKKNESSQEQTIEEQAEAEFSGLVTID